MTDKAFHETEIITHSAEETRNLGKQIGSGICPGTIIALTGDLGTGKTAFVQGLAEGLGVPAEYPITSPTYTLVCEYPGRCPLYHVDLYRLENIVDFEDIGLYDMLDSDGVVAIEWAERLWPELLSEAMRIRIEFSGDESRLITVRNSKCEVRNDSDNI